MKRKAIFLLALALLGIAWARAPEAARLEALFTERPRAEWFTDEFLKAVPTAQIEAIVGQFKRTLGRFLAVRPEGEGWVVVFERGEVPATITLNAAGKIAGLFFKPPRQRLASLREAKSSLESLPGEVHFLVLEGDRPLVSLNPGARLAVGSAFKLSVLAALLDAIERGERRWDEVVRLNPAWKSLPTGQLQNWPGGTPLTLADLAGRMMAESDNTATDHLIHTLGRAAVERFAYENRPLLSTRAFFVLRSDPGLLERYTSAGLEERRKLVAEAEARPLPSVTAFYRGPWNLEVEWHYSAFELCQLAYRALSTPISGINAGLARPEAWKQVAFKGGSEVGVLNLTTALVAKDGRRFCAVATWNARGLRQDRLMAVYGGVLELLAQREGD